MDKINRQIIDEEGEAALYACIGSGRIVLLLGREFFRVLAKDGFTNCDFGNNCQPQYQVLHFNLLSPGSLTKQDGWNDCKKEKDVRLTNQQQSFLSHTLGRDFFAQKIRHPHFMLQNLIPNFMRNFLSGVPLT